MLHIIEKKLIEKLNKKLPGINAQLKMAPQSRFYFEEKNKNNKRKRGGVLVLLYPKNEEINVVFIKRAEDGKTHSGQIAFPGGKIEKNDDNIIATALRESYEEIGINQQKVKVLGILSDLYIPVSNYDVTPVVATTTIKPNFKLNVAEVQKIIEVPLSLFYQPNNIKFQKRIIKNIEFDIPYYKVNGTEVWGATAMIMSELTSILPFNDLLYQN